MTESDAGSMRDLTIVIVNWNTGPLLRECLESLARFAPPGISWEVVVVDNASTDGSEEAACSGDARVRLIRSAVNLGFARANNEAIRATQSRTLLLLNPDTIFTEDCIGPLLARLAQDPTIGLIGCRLYNEDGSDQRSADLFPKPFYEIDPAFQWRRRALNRRLARVLRDGTDCEVETLTGAFQLLPRAVLGKTGLLDESLFMYAEDLDLCHRVRCAGFRILFDASASLVHLGGRSAGQVWSRAARLARVRSGVHRMQRKHFGAARADAGLFVRTVIGGLRGLSALRLAPQDERRQDALADALANGKILASLLRPAGPPAPPRPSVPKRPRVLHLTTTGEIAGTEQILCDLAEAHDRAAWDVSYATLLPAGEMNARIGRAGVPCYSLGLRRGLDFPAAVVSLAGLLRRERIDILHTHLLHAGIVGFCAASLLGARRPRLVMTRHYADQLYRFGPRWRAKLDALIARRQDRVCAISEAVRGILTDWERVRPDRVTVIHQGVNLERLRARSMGEARSEFGIGPDQPLLGVVAHLLEKKGHSVLLRALPAVRERFPDAHLLLAGRGPERERLEEETRRLGLERVVTFTGYRSDAPMLMAALDIIVQPSLEEGFGLAMVEAMALGKPVVATRTGGIPEVVQDGLTGVLVPPGDSPALASAIVGLLEDAPRRSALGEAGRRRAEDEFSIPRLAREYEAVWSTLLAEPEKFGSAPDTVSPAGV